MKITLQRATPGKLSISGELFVGGAHECYTLENKADAIPAGTYKVTLYPSPRLGRIVPLLNDVPGRSMIEMHWGNFPGNYAGCIGVGMARDTFTEEIYSTQEAFRELFPMIEAAVQTEGCQIEILDGHSTTSDLDNGDL